MNKKLRAYLEKRGLSPTATEEEALAYLDTIEFEQRSEPVPAAPAAPAAPQNPQRTEDEIRTESARMERERINEIRSMGEAYECPADVVSPLIASGTAIAEARRSLFDWFRSNKKTPKLRLVPPPELVFDERDKFRGAAEGGILIRSGISGVDPAKLPIGSREVAGFSLVEMARHCLRVAGLPFHGDVREVVGRALTTSDFPYILAAVANKSLFLGWETAGETWPIWCNTGTVNDFKTHTSVRVSEFSDLEEVPEDSEYKYGKRTEAQEQYKVVTYGKLGGISRQTIINDDLNAITTNMMGMGEAAARKIGDLPYAVLTANAAMGDGNALFVAAHGNFVDNGSGGPPGIATLAAGILAMGLQKDLQGLRRLNIRPQFFIAPKTLEGLSEVFFRSDRFADSNTVATDSSLAASRVNPYSGNYFTRVYEARLDDDDVAAWYLAAQKGKTVTVFFLGGQQAPYFETKAGWTVDGTEYKVRIDAGAKAMDWKGLYYNDGN